MLATEQYIYILNTMARREAEVDARLATNSVRQQRNDKRGKQTFPVDQHMLLRRQVINTPLAIYEFLSISYDKK